MIPVPNLTLARNFPPSPSPLSLSCLQISMVSTSDSKLKESSDYSEKKTTTSSSEGNLPTVAYNELILKTEDFVRSKCVARDSSHDSWHSERVRQLAVTMAEEEGLPPASMQIVELAALLHDIGDHKYASREGVGLDAVEEFLHSQSFDPEKTNVIMDIILRMGFKEELASNSDKKVLDSKSSNRLFPEFCVVQAADRLDAIGAIGIARCLTFGGARNRVLHDPSQEYRKDLTKEEYQNKSENSTTIHHFYEKLLKLKNLMKTESGKRRAEGRHKVMEDFLTQFYEEWDGRK